MAQDIGCFYRGPNCKGVLTSQLEKSKLCCENCMSEAQSKLFGSILNPEQSEQSDQPKQPLRPPPPPPQTQLANKSPKLLAGKYCKECNSKAVVLLDLPSEKLYYCNTHWPVCYRKHKNEDNQDKDKDKNDKNDYVKAVTGMKIPRSTKWEKDEYLWVCGHEECLKQLHKRYQEESNAYAVSKQQKEEIDKKKMEPRERIHEFHTAGKKTKDTVIGTAKSVSSAANNGK